MDLVIVILLALYGILATVIILRNPLPFPDKGFRIFTCSSPQALEAVGTLLESYGLAPRYRLDSSTVQRTLMADGMTVLNYPLPKLHEQMGWPSAALAVKAKNPTLAAQQAVDYLVHQGFTATVLGELDQDVPSGAMVFVATDAVPGVMLVFRKHVLRMGERPSRWIPRAT